MRAVFLSLGHVRTFALRKSYAALPELAMKNAEKKV